MQKQKTIRRRTVLTTVLVSVAAPLCLIALAGCRTNAETGALIGAGLGAAGGYIIGSESDEGYHHPHYHHGYYHDRYYYR